MNNNCFKFKLIDIIPYVKGDKRKYRLLAYCYFGFNVTLFITEEKMIKLNEEMKKSNFDINNYIKVFYDNTKQTFAYIINIK